MEDIRRHRSDVDLRRPGHAHHDVLLVERQAVVHGVDHRDGHGLVRGGGGCRCGEVDLQGDPARGPGERACVSNTKFIILVQHSSF